MIKIMFVCHGNICRSPMAEFIFKKLVADAQLSEHFLICSSATSTEEIYRGTGNPVYPPAKRELEKHGISCEGKRAVQLQKGDYQNYDMLIAMDENNVRNIYRIVGTDTKGKVHKLMSFTGTNSDVIDPWYSERFDIAYSDISAGCLALFEYLKKEFLI